MDVDKKILFVASEPATGMVPFAAAIINGEAGKMTEVHAITVGNECFDYARLLDSAVHHTSRQYPVKRFRKFWWKINSASLCKDIIKTAVENKIGKIFLLTGEYGLALFQIRKLTKAFEVVYVVHDLDRHPSKGEPILSQMWTRYFHLMTLRMARICKVLMTASRSQCQKLKEMYPEKIVKLFRFPSLVTEGIASGTDVCPEIDGKNGYILFFGAVGEYKGVHLLYEAFLSSNLPDRHDLVIAGKGTVYFKRCHDERNVIWINRYIPDSQVGELFRRARAVVYPYTQMTMSGVLTIAHYFKTPVIASDLQFFADNINDDTDILFPAGDVAALRECLNRI